MRVCGQEFTTNIIDRIGQIVADKPGISRRALSRHVCEWLNWRSSNGSFQEGCCRKALSKLHRQGILNLPEAKSGFSFQQPRQCLGSTRLDLDIPSVSCSLAELGEIEIVPITSRYCKDARIWRALLDQHHYLGSGTLSGAQIRYVIKSSTHGYLGALAFSCATWALKARDQYIGWDETARIRNLRYVVTNDRFLIVPTVRVANLASHVLSLALRRLPEDWFALYHVWRRPLSILLVLTALVTRRPIGLKSAILQDEEMEYKKLYLYIPFASNGVIYSLRNRLLDWVSNLVQRRQRIGLSRSSALYASMTRG